MKHLFDFSPDSTLTEIKLAFEYTPKVLQNAITKRPYTGLIYVVSGQYEYSYEDKNFIAGEGSIIYLPPRSIPYSYQVSKSARTMQVEIEFKNIDSTMHPAYASYPTLLATEAFAAYNSFKSVIDGFAKKDAVSKLALYSDLFSLLAVCSKFTENKNSDLLQKIAPAIYYLQENYTKSVSVKKLAQLCFISESQLRRLFSKLLGKSPIKYKNELILDAAKNLLQNSEFSIGEIADMLGFYDIYAFSHFFSNSIGTSPALYKKRRHDF